MRHPFRNIVKMSNICNGPWMKTGGWKKEQHGSAPSLALLHIVPEPGKANGSLDGSCLKRGEQGEHEKVSNLHQKVDI